MNKEPSAASRPPTSRLTGNFGCSPWQPMGQPHGLSNPPHKCPYQKEGPRLPLGFFADVCRPPRPTPDVHLSPSSSSAPSSAGENWLQSRAAIKAAGGQALGMVTARDQTLGSMEGGTSKPPTSNVGPGSKNYLKGEDGDGSSHLCFKTRSLASHWWEMATPAAQQSQGAPKTLQSHQPANCEPLPAEPTWVRNPSATPSLTVSTGQTGMAEHFWASSRKLILRMGVRDRARTHGCPEKVGGFKPKCWRAAELCLGRSFIAVSMPATSMASDTGYVHRKDEGKKHLALLIVLMKRRSISLYSKPEQMTLGHHVIQFQDDTISFSPILFFLMGYRQTHVGFPTPTGFLAWSKLLSEPNNQSKPRIKCSSPRRDLSEAGLALASQWLPPGQASYNLGSKYCLF